MCLATVYKEEDNSVIFKNVNVRYSGRYLPGGCTKKAT